MAFTSGDLQQRFVELIEHSWILPIARALRLVLVRIGNDIPARGAFAASP